VSKSSGRRCPGLTAVCARGYPESLQLRPRLPDPPVLDLDRSSHHQRRAAKNHALPRPLLHAQPETFSVSIADFPDRLSIRIPSATDGWWLRAIFTVRFPIAPLPRCCRWRRSFPPHRLSSICKLEHQSSSTLDNASGSRHRAPADRFQQGAAALPKESLVPRRTLKTGTGTRLSARVAKKKNSPKPPPGSCAHKRHNRP